MNISFYPVIWKKKIQNWMYITWAKRRERRILRRIKVLKHGLRSKQTEILECASCFGTYIDQNRLKQFINIFIMSIGAV